MNDEYKFFLGFMLIVLIGSIVAGVLDSKNSSYKECIKYHKPSECSAWK